MPGTSLSNLVALLEQIVMSYILVPARSSFSRSGTSVESSAKTSSSHTEAAMLPGFLAALRSAISTTTVQQPSSKSQSVRTETLLNSLPRVFLLAIRCCRWTGSKGRNDDLPWVEAVFRELAEIAGIQTTSQDGLGLSISQTSLLERLLQVGIDNSIFLGTTMLRIITINYCKLFTENHSKDRWALIEQIFKLDANIFLIPSHDENIPQLMRSLQNPLLEALFSKISALARQSGDEVSELQQRIHQQIFRPLMEDLANARALSGFFRYWHQNLSDLEERRLAGLDPALSVENITILEVRSNSESLRPILQKSLTKKQIGVELDWLRSSIEPLAKSSSDREKAQAFSALVILEAVLMSISREDNISSLREQALSLMDMILQQVRAGVWPKWHRWRLWRLLTEMNTLWLHHYFHEHTEGSSPKENLLQNSLKRACKIIEKGGTNKARSKNNTSVYREAYEAFGWILSLGETAMNRPFGLEDAFSEVKDAITVVHKLLNDGLEYPSNGSDQATNHKSETSWWAQWNGEPEGLKNQGTLVIALAACLILQYPSVLSLCSSTLRRDLLQSLYSSALTVGHSFTVHETTSEISFVDIWECALESEYILNHVELKDDLVGMIIEFHISDTPHVNGEMGNLSNELAIPSLLKLQISALRRKERERILDLLLEDRSSNYLAKNFEYLCHCLKGTHSFLGGLLTLGLVKQLLTIFWSHQDSLKFEPGTELKHWQARHLEILASDLKVLRREWSKSNGAFDIRSEVILDAIASIPGLEDLTEPNTG
ncbi:MAG: hypothetical protein M1816_001822 [Peltula sp. TS41687]|nr:MAG: hypothetical protein M1816_001822 [Peltula sp. TS41687]